MCHASKRLGYFRPKYGPNFCPKYPNMDFIEQRFIFQLIRKTETILIQIM